MKSLKETGKYTLDESDFEKISEEFCGFFADEEETSFSIRDSYENFDYLMDTHTAVGYTAVRKYLKQNPGRKVVLASTASPYKFACDVYRSLFEEEPQDELSALSELSRKTKTEIPTPLSDIATRNVRFETIIEKENMKNSVIDFAKS